MARKKKNYQGLKCGQHLLPPAPDLSTLPSVDDILICKRERVNGVVGEVA